MAKGDRKLYAYEGRRQHRSISGYVDKNRSPIDSYLNEHRDAVLAEKDAAKAAGKRYLGHDMRFADGKLKRGYKASLGKATSGGRVAGEMKRAKKMGRPSSVTKARRFLTSQHVVKFGVDPYHS